MENQKCYRQMTEPAGGFPEDIPVVLVETLRMATRSVGADRANACKDALALALLKQNGVTQAAIDVITSMENERNRKLHDWWWTAKPAQVKCGTGRHPAKDIWSST